MAERLRVRIDEGLAPQPQLLWDSVWVPMLGHADWAVAGADEPLNRGGLQAEQAIATAVVNALFMNVACPPDHPLRYLVGDDLMGWWGDGVDLREDLGEAPLGSLLWMLERAPLTTEIVQWADTMCREALAPLIFQGVAARIDVEAVGNELKSRIDLFIAIYSRDGTKTYDNRFEPLWVQTR